METIAERVAAIQTAIQNAARQSGRAAGEIALLAVSKTKPDEAVAEAFAAGQVRFGENRVQEIERKAPALPERIEWHLIGPLQKNKVRKVLPHVHSIHSVDSLKIAERIDRIAGDLGLQPQIYLQVNVAQDPAKAGFAADEIEAQFDALCTLKNLQIEGLMTIPAWDPNPEETRPHFATLRELRDRLRGRCDLPLPGLSMGMSGDYQVAIAEGSTMVRVGTAIFGER